MLTAVVCLTAAPGNDDRADSLCGLNRILVLPHSNAGPAGLRKPAIRFPIPDAVALDLLRPKSRVRYGDGVVFRAPMPKTSIEKHRDFGSRKDQVGGTPQVVEWTGRHTVAKPGGMDGRAKRNLRLGVLALIRLHARPNAG